MLTPEEVTQEIAQWERNVVDIIISRTAAKTPVASGLLQSSWTGSITNDTLEISNPVDYAGYVEFGTVKMAPVGMLSTTLLEMEQIAQEALRGTRL